MRIRDGFPGQRLRVLPSRVSAAASRVGSTSRLLVTDAGYFPRAMHHGRSRTRGAEGAIVILCVGGAGWCRWADDGIEVESGQVLLVPAGAPHRYGAADSDPWTIWWLHAAGPDAQTLTDEVLGARGSAASVPVAVPVHDVFRVAGGIERAVEALETDETRASLLRASGAGYEVLSTLAADAHAGDPRRGGVVRQAQEYLRDHLEAPVSVAALARTAGLSVSHFAALFRSATGGGVVEYAKRLRMAHACELLITTAMPVNEVARTVGYSDPLYFSRHFRGVHGCSPTEFRDGARG